MGEFRQRMAKFYAIRPFLVLWPTPNLGAIATFPGKTSEMEGGPSRAGLA